MTAFATAAKLLHIKAKLGRLILACCRFESQSPIKSNESSDVDCEESLPTESVSDKWIMLSFENLSNSNLLLIDGDSNASALCFNRMFPVVSFLIAAVHFAALVVFWSLQNA